MNQKIFTILISLLFSVAVYGTRIELDSLLSQAREYTSRSMPDDAIPLLLKILESESSGEELIWNAKIQLAEAYRQKTERKKGIGLLQSMLKENDLPPLIKASAYNRLAALFNESEDLVINRADSALFYSLKCVEIAQKENLKGLLASSQNEIAYIYRSKDNFPLAQEYGENAYQNFIELGYNENAINTAINLAGAYLSQNKFEQALNVTLDAFSLSSEETNPNLYMRLYLRKAHVYEKMKDFENAYFALSKARVIQHQYYQDRLKIQINEMTAKYDLKLKEDELEVLAQKQKASKQLQIFLIVFLILIIIISLITIMSLSLFRKNRLQKQKLIENENKQLRTELEIKEKDFQFKENQLTKAISNSIVTNDGLNKLKKLLINHHYSDAINLINSLFSSKIKWEQFLSEFNELYPDFLKNLNHYQSGLTVREIELCVLLVLNMKTKEIATFLNISDAAVSKGRNRLRKKLNLPVKTNISVFLKKYL